MTNELILPGIMPDLLRRGSPLQYTVEGGFVHHATINRHLCIWMQGQWLQVADFAECCALDLNDMTGRAHACWWLSAQDGNAAWLTACVGEHIISFQPAETFLENEGVYCPVGLWVGDRFYGCESHDYGDDVCPALANLDPNDPRTLEDGSRFVDAEALRLVCLHVYKEAQCPTTT